MFLPTVLPFLGHFPQQHFYTSNPSNARKSTFIKSAFYTKHWRNAKLYTTDILHLKLERLYSRH